MTAAIHYRLRKDDPFKGVILEVHVQDTDDALAMAIAQDFTVKVYETMPRKSGWFHQSGATPGGGPSDYHMFEFWNFSAMPEAVVKTAEQIGDELGLKLLIAPEVKAIIETKQQAELVG